MKLIEVIEQGMPKYTKTERIIADYITNHLLEFTVASIGMVADTLNISKTSLIRFAKKMGFEGYLEFRKKLQDEEIIAYTPSDRFKRMIGKEEHKSLEILERREVDNILQCCASLNYDDLNQMIDHLSSANKVYISGRDVASFVARVLWYRLNRFNFPVEYVECSFPSLTEEIMYGREGDVLIVFEFPDYSNWALAGMQYARKKGMKVVLVTDYVGCPLVPEADLVFYCESQTDLLKNSLTAPLFFVNLLVSRICYRDNNRMLDLLNGREEVADFEKK